MNITKILQKREITSARSRLSNDSSMSLLFNMRVTHHFDDPSSISSPSPLMSLLMQPSRVYAIVPAGNNVLVFILYQSGVCVAYNTHTKKRVCFMNVFPHTFIITKVYYNPYNNSVITISTPHNSSTPSAVSTSITYVKCGQPEAGFHVFASDIQSGGFLECDMLTGKAITCHQGLYKVYELKNYERIFSVSDKNVKDISTTVFGSIILLHNRIKGQVPIKIISLEDNTVHKLNVSIQRHREIQLIEQVSQTHVLVKQEGKTLQLFDIQSKLMLHVGNIDMFKRTSGYYFLHRRQLLLTFTNQNVYIWNYNGELVSSYKDPYWNSHYMPSGEDFYISYANKADSRGLACSTVYIHNIISGKCMSEINVANGNITTLAYDEHRKEIFTGNSTGIVNVLAN